MTDTLSAMERELKFFPVQNDSPGKLTCEQIRQFNGLGYVCPLDVFTPEEADFNRRYFDELRLDDIARARNESMTARVEHASRRRILRA